MSDSIYASPAGRRKLVEQTAVYFGTALQSVDSFEQQLCDLAFPKGSPLARALADELLSGADIIVLYSVEGEFSSDGGQIIHVLSPSTFDRAPHDAALSVGRLVRYLVVHPPPTTDECNTFTVTPLELRLSRQVTARNVSALIYGPDMPTLTGANDLVASYERGNQSVDLELASAALVAWVQSVISKCESMAIKARGATASLGFVEAHLQVLGCLQAVCEALEAPEGLCGKLTNYLPKSSVSMEALAQKRARLMVFKESVTDLVHFLYVIVPSLYTIKLNNSALHIVYEQVASWPILLALLVSGCSPVMDHHLGRSFFCRLVYDIIEAVERAVALDDAAFHPPETEDSCSVKTISMPPRIIDGSLFNVLAQAESCLRLLVSIFPRVRELTDMICGAHGAFARESPDGTPAVDAAAYAADRCAELQSMITRIRSLGLDCPTDNTIALCKTLERAASRFPLLRLESASNWQKCNRSFERIVLCKFTTPDDVEYDHPVDAARDQTPPEGKAPLEGQSSESHPQQIQQPTGSFSADERSILQSRVTLLSHELSDCRRLVQQLQDQLAARDRELAAANEMNLVLLASMSDRQSAAAKIAESFIETECDLV